MILSWNAWIRSDNGGLEFERNGLEASTDMKCK